MISTKDIAFVMRSIGYQATPSELEQMIRHVDQDGLFLLNV
jgi:Ca2+-binding EF-hand superfamily protein